MYPRPKTSYIREATILDLERKFAGQVTRAQNRLARIILDDYLDELRIDDGKITFSARNISKTNNLNQIYEEWIDEEGTKLMRNLVDDLKKMHRLNAVHYNNAQSRNVDDAKILKNMMRRIGYDDEAGRIIPGGFLDGLIQSEDPINEVKAAALRAIASGEYTPKQMRELIGRVTKGDRQSDGVIEEHLGEHITDIHSQYDRETGKQFADLLKLNYTIYQGGIIKTSRPFCRVRNDKVFTRDEIRLFGTPQDQYGGYSDKGSGDFQGKTPNYNPFLDLGGYNCRHMLDWLSDELGEYLYNLQQEQSKWKNLAGSPDDFDKKFAYMQELNKRKNLDPDQPFTLDLRTMTDVDTGYLVKYDLDETVLIRLMDQNLRNGDYIIHWDGEKFVSMKRFKDLNTAILFGWDQKQVSIYDVDNHNDISLIDAQINLDDTDKINEWFKNDTNLLSLDLVETNKYGLINTDLKGFEEIIYSKDYEVGGMYDDDETLFMKIEGEARQIDLRGFNKEHGYNRIFTHNHPSWIKDEHPGRGNSFSVRDIMTSLNFGLKEMRAVTKKYVYSMKFDEIMWIEGRKFEKGHLTRLDFDRVFRRINRINREVTNEFQYLVDTGKLTENDASYSHWDEVWTRFVENQKGITYVKRER